MNHYKNRYKYLGEDANPLNVAALKFFLDKHSDYIDGYNFLYYEKELWLILKFCSDERKIYFFDNIWQKQKFARGKTKPWDAGTNRKWPDLPEDNYYKKQIRHLQKEYPEVFCYESQQ